MSDAKGYKSAFTIKNSGSIEKSMAEKITKILITDDSENWIKYHAFALEELFNGEVKLIKAESAKEGVEKLIYNLKEPFDIILTDMQMEPDYLPTLAGEWFIQQIRTFKEYDNTKIVIISATSSIKDIAKKYNVEYIPKYSCRYEGAYDKIKALL